MLTRHLAAAYHHAILSPCSSGGDLDIDWIDVSPQLYNKQSRQV